MYETEPVEDHAGEKEFDDLLRRAEAYWLTILKDKSDQLTQSNPQDKPPQKVT
jgi:hypothetical protein